MKRHLPKDSAARKTFPLYEGLFGYFPDILAAIAHHSFVSNEQHNPGQSMHWSREKSSDHLDAALRHITEGDLVAAGWRMLAAGQNDLERKHGYSVPRNATDLP